MVPLSAQMCPKIRPSVHVSTRYSSIHLFPKQITKLSSYRAINPCAIPSCYKMPYFGTGTLEPMDTMNIIYPISSNSASLSVRANPDIAPVYPPLHPPLSSGMSPEANQSAAKRSVRWCDPIQPREGGGTSVIH
jgi:hypothetical protein